MQLHHQHAWNLGTAEARDLQKSLAEHAEATTRLPAINRVAGADVGFDKARGLTRAAVCVLDFETLQPVESRVIETPTTFPYVPGLLSFREVPAVLEALDQLSEPPQLILCDGQGYAHPRRFGLACHLGVLTDIATIGVAKSRLIGQHVEPPQQRGAWSELRHDEETIGAVLRTRVGVRPLYVSIGHRVDLSAACQLTMRCVTRYRLPETTRYADRMASKR